MRTSFSKVYIRHISFCLVDGELHFEFSDTSVQSDDRKMDVFLGVYISDVHSFMSGETFVRNFVCNWDECIDRHMHQFCF